MLTHLFLTRAILAPREKTVKKIAVGLLFQHNQNCVKGFFQELQSKRIYRVAGGYIVSAWVILQGEALRGWARSASGHTAEGISWIENGIGDYRATGSILDMPFLLALKAEALHLADRTSEALDAMREAQALVERFEVTWWCAELHRLRGVFLTALGAEETQIEASFCEAISIAKEQKSVSLEKRAGATYAEYRRQKEKTPGGHSFRLPLC